MTKGPKSPAGSLTVVYKGVLCGLSEQAQASPSTYTSNGTPRLGQFDFGLSSFSVIILSTPTITNLAEMTFQQYFTIMGGFRSNPSQHSLNLHQIAPPLRRAAQPAWLTFRTRSLR